MARLRKALLGLSLVLGLLLAAALVWRAALVEVAGRLLLSGQGFDEARFGVAEVGAGAIVLEDLALGEGLPAVRRVRLTYDPVELLSGRLRGLRVEGLRYQAPEDWRAALASLEGGTSGGGWQAIPRVEIADAVVSVPAPVPGTIALNGALDLSGERPGAALEVVVDLAGLAGRFTVSSEAFGEGGAVEISGAGEADLTGLVLPVASGVTASGGRGRFTVEGTARLPVGGADWDALRSADALSLAGTLALSGITSSVAAGRLSLDTDWALTGGDGALRLDLPRPARLVLSGAPPKLLAAFGFAVGDDASRDLVAEIVAPGPVVAWSPGAEGGQAKLSADIRLELGDAHAAARVSATVEHDAAWRLTTPAALAIEAEASGLDLATEAAAAELRLAKWSATGAMQPDGTLSLEGPAAVELAGLVLEGIRATSASAAGDLRFAGRPGGWSVHVAPGLAVAVEGAGMPGTLDLVGPLRLAVQDLAVVLGGGARRLELRAFAEPVSGTLGGTGGAIAFAEAAGSIGVLASLGERLQGEITLAAGRVTLPSQAVALDSLSGRWPLGGTAGAGAVALSGELRDTGRSVRFAPLHFALEGDRNGDAVAFIGTATAAGGAVGMPIAGSADVAAASGRIAAGPARITFRPGGLQPGALSPRLAAFRDVAGAVRVSAEAALDAAGVLRTSASLSFEDLAARMADIEVTGLAGRVRLGRLAPLVTAGPQELSARRVTAGVPLEQPRIRFSLEPGRRGPRLHIHEAAAELSGGRVAVEEALWDSAAGTNAFTVQVHEVRLGRLLSDWRIEGISGSGRLSGEIPVHIGHEGIAVEGGRLAATGPGVVQVDWGTARETLVGSAEQVALAVRALEDFRYEALTIGVSQPASGELTLAIGLEGANPAVLDGYPFRFNITLSGQLAPILEAVREGRRIGAGLLHGGLGGP